MKGNKTQAITRKIRCILSTYRSVITCVFSPFHTLTYLSVYLFICSFLILSCARPGQPDGGWYDETPPRVVGATPADKATKVSSRKFHIRFNEFIKIDNPTENVIVSPPQLEMPEIKGAGKNIIGELKDSLKVNTTYTIDFSDAISDNNEGNPLGNYTYTFSTGEIIDTMEVSGYVLEANNLEPIKGILVGLYSDLADSAFKTRPMLRVSRSDSRGRFVIKGIAPGKYRIYALKDADGDYRFTQKSEEIAFSHDLIVPSFKDDIRQDTIWRDSLRIDSIIRVGYTHFLPDDIMLRAFTHTATDRYFQKAERTEANHFTLFFSAGHSELPRIKGLNFNADNAFIIETSAQRDTLTYWLKDTTLINQDTLQIQMQFLATDSTGVLKDSTETLEILSKQPYAKRQKEKQKQFEEWKKAQDKARKKGDKYETEMKKEALKVDIKLSSELDPDRNITLSSPVPLARIDTSKIHLYSKHDSLWYQSRYELYPQGLTDSIKDLAHDLLFKRDYEFSAEWKPTIEYSLELDSAALIDIYGNVSDKIKKGFKVKSEDDYSTLLVTLIGMQDTSIVVQLLNGSDAVVKEVVAEKGIAHFFYLNPGTYYMRMFIDTNQNGKWDTGDYDADRQPETVYYYPEEIECKAKWDVSRTWNPTERLLSRQKPGKITKQKPDKEKTIKRRNFERARDLGIPYHP